MKAIKDLDELELGYFKSALRMTPSIDTGTPFDVIAELEDLWRLLPEWVAEQLAFVAAHRPDPGSVRDEWEAGEELWMEHGGPAGDRLACEMTEAMREDDQLWP